MAAEHTDVVWGIVLAGGSGRRFGGPKQFELLDGVRLVDRAIAAIRPHCAGIVLVLPDGTHWDGPPVDELVVGGATHGASTVAALAALPPDATQVMITAPSHPLVTTQLVRAVLAAVAAGADGAAPLLPLADAVKVVEAGAVRSVRTEARPAIAQLPFVIRRTILDEAMAAHPDAAEELDAVERMGGLVVGVPGDPANLHIASPEDLELARAILRR